MDMSHTRDVLPAAATGAGTDADDVTAGVASSAIASPITGPLNHNTKCTRHSPMQSSYMPHLHHSHASATTTKAARGKITSLRVTSHESRVVGNELSVLHPLAVALDSEGVDGVHQLFGA